MTAMDDALLARALRERREAIEERDRAVAQLADVREALDAFAGLLEAEWYNGNIDEPAYLALNADLTGIVALRLPLEPAP